jgi:hypothetical protein
MGSTQSAPALGAKRAIRVTRGTRQLLRCQEVPEDRVISTTPIEVDDPTGVDQLVDIRGVTPGGVVAVSDAPAAWGVVLAEGLVPLLVSDGTIYGVLQLSDAAWCLTQ